MEALSTAALSLRARLRNAESPVVIHLDSAAVPSCGRPTWVREDVRAARVRL